MCVKNYNEAKNKWHTAIILATWETEIGRIKVCGQSRQKVCETSISVEKSGAQWCAPVIPTNERSLK
jgi:hypothetical protein